MKDMMGYAILQSSVHPKVGSVLDENNKMPLGLFCIQKKNLCGGVLRALLTKENL